MNKVEFLLTNPEFVRWVRHPDKDLDTYWKNWLDANPERSEDLKMAREIVEGIQFEKIIPKAEMRDEVLASILKESSVMEDTISKGSKRKNSVIDWYNQISQMYKVAAIVVFALMLYLPNVLFKNNAPEAQELNRVPLIEKITAQGEKLSITLPDGSRVWLNSGSKLEFPEKFAETERYLSISGEAYFEVKKDTLRPFRVESDGFVTTALGTSFNINTKSGSLVKISLVTGKVSVDKNLVSEQVILNPGQEFNFDKVGFERWVGKFDPAKVIAWKEGKIIFENASLSQVIQTLEDWYGVKFTVKNGKNVNWQFSGEYQNQILENVLNSISFSENFEYAIDGKNVELKF